MAAAPLSGASQAPALRNLAWLDALALSRNLMFAVPVLVPFWRGSGLGMTELMLLQSYFSVLAVALEVPTGMLADRFGRRLSLLAGMAALAAAVGTYAVGHSLAIFLVAETLFALGHALTSGADVALLHDSLQAGGRGGDYARRFGRYQALQLAAGAASSLLGGWWCADDPRLGWWLTLPVLLLGLWPCWRLVEPRPIAREAAGGASSWRDLLPLLREPSLRALLLLGAGTWGLNRAVQWLLQPYFEQAGLGLEAFGALLAGGMLLAALASQLSGAALARLGARRMGLGLVLLAGLAFAAMAWAQGRPGIALPVGLAALAAQQLVAGSVHTLYTTALNQRLPDALRATGLSMQALLGTAAYAGSIPLLGLTADSAGLGAALALLAALVASLLLPLWARARAALAATASH